MTTQSSASGTELLVQLAPMMLVVLVLVVPFVRILQRAGRSGWWALILFVPALGWLILPWMIAFMRWERPREDLGEVFR